MTEIEKLQQKHREEAAMRRLRVKEQKARTRRLIERGAILESALKELTNPEELRQKEVERIVFFAILDPDTVRCVTEILSEKTQDV